MSMTPRNKISSDSICPCGSGNTFSSCCESYIAGKSIPATAETLMRSRYSAYVIGAADYLLSSWHQPNRPARLDLDQPSLQWLGLKICLTMEGGITDTQGMVEFIARYKINGRAQRLHEASQFIKENGQWFYVQGTQLD